MKIFELPTNSKRAFTLIEVMVTVILVSLVFGIAYRIMGQARREARKGFWLQKATTELRNGTRAISMRLKKTSYPTTIVKSGGKQIVISYKEKRVFDESGRLRNLISKTSTGMDLTTYTGAIESSAASRRLMVFPMCTPETDLDTYTPGLITWVEVILEPGDKFSFNKLGQLVILEHEEGYDTRSLADRVFSLEKSFDPKLPVVTRKVWITDVARVKIDTYSTEELAGVVVTKAGQVSKKMKKRFLVSVRIECQNPFDKAMLISDQCSVTVNTDVKIIP